MPPRRSGLGRGLDSLLPSQGRGDELEGKGSLDEIELDQIDPNPRQPRSAFEDAALAELTTSIRELGVLQPLLVRAMPSGRFELIAGERRLRAARSAGRSSVPVVIVETDERGSLERALVENLHREDLNAIEEAAAYKQLIEDGGLTQEALGEKLGRTRGTISNSMRLLDLPVPIQRLLIEGRLTAGHGRALLGLENPVLQERLGKRVAAEELSVRKTEDVVRTYQGMSGGTGASPRLQGTERSPMVAEAQRRLGERLQTRVRVEMGKRKGKIVVDFVSLEELDRLLDVMVGEVKDAQVVSPGS
ncbi:MAG: ParB family transcriptional regulator, chromosome partitioning protein [Actinomycetota bacterium]|nr:ParB family transcriptional regulator, chromosome partitioning protein [Actinomycetota bacterium]